MPLPWIKLFTEIIDDPKIGRLPESCKWRFIQLLLLAGECDREGYLIAGEKALDCEEIAWRLRLDSDQLTADFESLVKTNCLAWDQDSNAWVIPKFSERQGRTTTDQREVWRD